MENERRKRERDKENSGLTEGEKEHWSEMEMAWIINGNLCKRTPEYFQ